ncbi:RelA/SpoT domain-containing protein [Brachymonas denitrificans]|uniref:RelA/SpoT domain-containing protein n=1 Tax=Brachymonas denitrificans TaxID=28220 RepID=UPI002AFFA0F0|nr:RelA/SpoT domain-containing protein [Brachymonas denitrificans]
MAFAKLEFSKGEVNRAGDLLISKGPCEVEDFIWATKVLANWRGCHLYPINTFQALLRQKLKSIDSGALVAQRLKRAPSIVSKLQRFEGMKLARMQDIGGLRAVVTSMVKLRKLETAYRRATFKHKLVSSKDYIAEPKIDGYRSIHLIYKYSNSRAPDYEGLSIELQLRTILQHAWATAVETMGTFLGQALKSGQGETDWREFFQIASAALAIVEKCPVPPGFEGLDAKSIAKKLALSERKLQVLNKLSSFAIAANSITKERGQGAYHLVILDSSARTVTIRPFSQNRLDEANKAYAEIEARSKGGENIEAVLVSAGPIDALRKAYPNYFLDTQVFVREINKIIQNARSII